MPPVKKNALSSGQNRNVYYMASQAIQVQIQSWLSRLRNV